MTTTYRALCDKSWFYGSELTSVVPAGSYGTSQNTAIDAMGSSEVHVYGSNIRSLSHDKSNAQFATVQATNEASVHIHGTGIDTISDSGQDITVLKAYYGGFIHANASAYVVTTSGNSTRVTTENGGVIHAPYQWQHIPDATTGSGFTTANGADTATVVTGTSDGHPHTVVYSSQCPPEARWYDQADRICRGQ